MKLCCVPGCSVGYELGIHVALRPLRQSVLLVMLVFDCCPREYPAMYVASIIVLSLIPRLSCVGREKRVWYTLFAHAQLSQDFWEFGNFP